MQVTTNNKKELTFEDFNAQILNDFKTEIGVVHKLITVVRFRIACNRGCFLEKPASVLLHANHGLQKIIKIIQKTRKPENLHLSNTCTKRGAAAKPPPRSWRLYRNGGGTLVLLCLA